MQVITDAAVLLPLSEDEAAAVTRSLRRLRESLAQNNASLDRPLADMLLQLDQALARPRGRIVGPASPAATRRSSRDFPVVPGPGERWSSQQVADRLGYADDSYVRRMARAGTWPAKQDGGRWWFTLETVKQLVEARDGNAGS